MPIVDEISPTFYAEDRIRLTLNPNTPEPRAFQALQVDVDYSQADGFGRIALPLELIISPPTKANFRRDIIRKVLPTTIVLKPTEGGQHLVLLREIGHNLFVGRLTLDVAGDPLEENP